MSYVVAICLTNSLKCDRYEMPLLEIVGITSTKNTFAIAFVFMAGESAEHYSWALRRLRHLCGQRLPEVIFTYRELGLIKVLREELATVKHMLCTYHIMCNIEMKGRITKSTEKRNAFYNECKALFESKTEESYEARLQAMKSKWEARWGLMKYLEDTWLIEFKEAIVRAWVDKFLHLGVRTTNK